MSSQATSKAIRNATSSPASAGGRMRSGSPGGPMTSPSGLAPVRVSRFRARDSGRAMPTNDTSGPLFTASSPSAALQRSLENRLRAALGVNGSPEYALTWKHWDMPSGPPICALRASARRTSDSGFTGWPTPCQQDGPNGGPAQGSDRLPGAAALAGWATPTSRDHKDGATDLEKAGVPINGLLGRQVSLASGPTTSSPAQTEKRGALNPAHSRWLMGYPAAWDSCGATAMQSCRRSRRRS